MTHEPFRSLREPDREHLELRVPEPVIRCARCGDVLPFGRIGRCDDCIGRGGNAIGCLALAIAVLALLTVLLTGSLAAGVGW